MRRIVVCEDPVLAAIDRIDQVLCPSGRSGIGPQGYEPLVLFMCLLIGQSLPATEPPSKANTETES